MRDEVKKFVKYMRGITLQMLNVQVKKLQVLRDRMEETGDTDRAQGIQDAIDSIRDTVAMGNSITEEDIEEKLKDVEEVHEQIKVSGGSLN